MSIKYGSNRFIPRPGAGDGLWQLYGANVVGLVDLANYVAIGATAMLSDEKLLVAGGITSTPSGAGNDAFLETGANNGAVVSDPNSIRLIYNTGTAQAEISTNGGAYLPIALGAPSPWVAAAGVITEVNPGNVVVVGSGAALNANQFQVLGDSTFRPVIDSTATLDVQDALGSSRFQVDTVNNAAVVTGSYQMIGPAAEVYLESQPSTAPNAAVNQGRIRYNNAGTPSWQGSVNGGAFSDFITAATLPTLAFVQGGNSFGAIAQLGTTDIKDLAFITNTAERARITTNGELLVGYTIAVGTEKLGVAGSAYVQDERLTSATGYLESVSSTAAVSAATEGRLRYSNASLAWQVSVNGGAYVDLITSSSISSTAFVQGGNTFGATANLGTNDNHDLAIRTNGATKATLLKTGEFLVGTSSTTYSEKLGVVSSYLGSVSTKASAYVQSTVTTTDSGALVGAWVNATSAINAPNTASTVQGVLARADVTGTAAVNLVGTQAFAGAGAGATGVTVTNAYAVNAVIGFDATAVSGTITTAYGVLVNRTGLGVGKTITTLAGVRISNLATAQVTNAIGIDILAQSGALTLNLGIRSQAAVVLGNTNVSGTEILRVSAGGALIDGTDFVASVTGACSINSSGAPINIGNNADAQAINVGTGAAARTITIGNATGATSVIVNAGTGNIDIGTGAQARTVRLATGGAAQAVTLGSTFATSSMTIDTGGALSIATSATNRTVSFATAAANQTINFGSVTGTSSLNFFYGSAGWNTTQANATTGTPVGFLYTAGTHTGLSSAEATDVNWNTGRTVTFGAGGGTIATQRAYRIQGPTYAAAAALTITEVATLSVGIPVVGANVTFTSGATAPTLPTDSGAAGGAYSLVNSPGVRVEGGTANTTVGVSMLLKNTTASGTAMPAIGWASSSSTLDAAMGVQTGNAFNHQRFVLMLRANATLTPMLSISTQGGYRFTNTAPNDAATTPAGFLFTGAANGAINTYAATVEANQFTVDSSQTYTFATGAIATQRSALFRAPTYAFSAASTITDAATLAITSAPITGAAATFTRSMALWVQAGAARFDGGVSVSIVPGGTALQGLGADFRKQNNPANATYNAGTTTVIVGGSYTPATGYLSIVPAWWTLPVATVDPVSGGAVLTGIRFTWSDGTTTTRTNASTVAALTETRDAIDFNKDGYTITSVQFIVQNTTVNNVTFDFAAWTVDGQQY